jgi:hypothetical protein
MCLDDLLTGRAQRNIDLLIQAIDECNEDVALALKLCLTAASDQMTRMVFAVTGRGKTTGKVSTKTEVGSWVIGFWRPQLHFDVIVWNCFNLRASALIEAIKDGDPLAAIRLWESIEDVVNGNMDGVLVRGDARRLLDSVPDESVDLIVTDPPHGDRLPYLELSELWNSILGFAPDFDREIVISNAKERGKTPLAYQEDVRGFITALARVQAPGSGFPIFADSVGGWTARRSRNILVVGGHANRFCCQGLEDATH